MTSIALELPTGCQLIGSHVTRTYVPRVAYTHCTARSTGTHQAPMYTRIHGGVAVAAEFVSFASAFCELGSGLGLIAPCAGSRSG